MTITDCIDRFRSHLRVTLGFRPGTIDRYCYTLQKFEEWCRSAGVQGEPDYDVAEISQADIEAWLKDLYYQHNNLVNSTRAPKLAAVKKFFAWLVYDGAIDAGSDPAKNIPSPKVAKVMPQKFSASQLTSIFASPDITKPMGIRDLAILTVLYTCGPRAEEIRGIDIGDLRYTGNDMFVYIRGKGAKERTVRLKRRAASRLKNWLAIRESVAVPAERAVFVSFRPPRPGTRLSKVTYNNILKKYAAAVGITDERVFVHKMRSTFATDLYDDGNGLIEISILMGHSTVDTTQGYIAISEKVLKKTAISDKRLKSLEGGVDYEIE